MSDLATFFPVGQVRPTGTPSGPELPAICRLETLAHRFEGGAPHFAAGPALTACVHVRVRNALPAQ